MKLLCLLRYRPNLFGLAPIEGHSYYETYGNKDVQILKCMVCGHYSVGYFDGGEPLPPYMSKKADRSQEELATLRSEGEK